MKQIILFFIFSLSCSTLFAQEPIQEIAIKRWLGKKTIVFVQDNESLSFKEMLDITKENEKAYQEMKLGRKNHNLGVAASWIGLGMTYTGLLIGLSDCPNNECIKNSNKQLVFSSIGLATYLLAIPLLKSGKKHTRNAVYIYNEGLSTTGMKKWNPQLGLADNGLGLKVSF